MLASATGQYDTAQTYLKDALRYFATDDPTNLAHIYYALGIVGLRRGQPTQAGEQFQHGLVYAKTVAEPASLAQYYREIGLIAEHLGDIVKARSYLWRAYEIFETAGIQRGKASLLNLLTNQAIERGEYAVAKRYGLQAEQAGKLFEPQSARSLSQLYLAEIALAQGDHDDARQRINVAKEALSQLKGSHFYPIVPLALGDLLLQRRLV